MITLRQNVVTPPPIPVSTCPPCLMHAHKRHSFHCPLETSVQISRRMDRLREARLLHILHAVCHEFSISMENIISRSRRHKFSYARFAFVWLAREITGRSYPQITRILGYRDHTSAIHGYNRADTLRRDDAKFRARTDAILKAYQREDIRG